ncbi:MAG: SAM-dependent methyltransferase [Firmicutes bacterium]|nr:SAM-dependent methyltransferase [Bacillota bacterium]
MSKRPGAVCDDYREIVKQAFLDNASFVQMTFSHKLRDDGTPWTRIKVRPVDLKDGRKIQFSYFDPKKDITKNYSAGEATARLDQVLGLAFGQIYLQTRTEKIQIRLNRKGNTLITRKKLISETDLGPGTASLNVWRANMGHNRQKSYPLPAERPDPFLQAIGLMNSQGKILAPYQAKFRQINEFLRVIAQTTPETGAPLRIIDCGCGSAYLTFAAYHYLAHLCGRPVHVLGIDRNPELIEKCRKLQATLSWPKEDLGFYVAGIEEFSPPEPPEMVLSLHACDTATDAAIARGVHWRSGVILAVPCCQHELHDQLRAPLFRPVLRHGILKERLADILTDTFRALLLRIMGYQTSVVEFITPDATAKNLLIRAEKTGKPGDEEFIKEYKELKNFWQVRPALEGMLGEEIKKFEV